MESIKHNSVLRKQKWFYRSAVATLVGLILVFLAGSLVKATDSGMGCPDWPKCFGHLIPPMDSSAVYFNPETDYFEGQMIIEGNSLWKAKLDFKSESEFNTEQWELFETHDYATYNPVNTAIEYINRLVSVLLGLTALAMVFFSFQYRGTKNIIPLLSTFVLFLIGFEAWLGRLVVDSVLAPRIITLHLFAGYLLILTTSLLIGLVAPLSEANYSRKGKIYFTIAFLLLLIQLVLGTQLREVFDELYQTTAADRSDWIAIADLKFLVHRSFSLVYALFLILAAVQFKEDLFSNPQLKKSALIIAGMVLLEILSGVIMEHLNIPRFAQPMHVLVSSILFAAHSYTCVLVFRRKV